MFELIIRKKNGDIYWIERFSSLQDAQEWLTEEQTRPYWNPEYESEITDKTPPPPTQDELDAIAARKNQIGTLKTRLKAMAAQTDFTNADIKEFLMKLGKLVLLKGDFD